MWTAGALESSSYLYSGQVWRVVESVAKVSTLKLVDTLNEQEVLEQILDRTKPKMPAQCKDLHFLLATPFRYAPYPYGSRFRRANQSEGAFYCSESVDTAIAEMAFYRLLFFSEAPGMQRPDKAVEHSAFRVGFKGRVLDLTAPSMATANAVWTHPTDYTACQEIADAARAASFAAIRYKSIRDPDGGANLAILDPKAFTDKEPTAYQTWRVFVRSDRIQAICEMPSCSREYKIEQFAADVRILGRLNQALGA